MKIVADRVSKGHAGIPLPETTLAYETGRVTIAEAEVGDHPTVLALMMSGRMRTDSGQLTIDGADDSALVRERVALVDAPDVSEPTGDLLLKDVVREELVFAGRSASRDSVARAIAENGGADYAGVRIADVPAGIRVRILTEIAAFRAGVRGIVITSPDRHGGDPRDWLAVARELADRDFAVLVVCGYASAEIVRPLLPANPVAFDAPVETAPDAAPDDAPDFIPGATAATPDDFSYETESERLA